MKFKDLEHFLSMASEIKRKYNAINSSFFNEKKAVEERKRYRDTIYSIPCKSKDKWKINKVWEYLNKDIDYELLEEIIRRK